MDGRQQDTTIIPGPHNACLHAACHALLALNPTHPCLSTHLPQIGFVGHSQGGALLLMLLANMPLYNSAISINLNIAPVVHAKYIQSPILVSFFRSANVGAGAGHGGRALVRKQKTLTCNLSCCLSPGGKGVDHQERLFCSWIAHPWPRPTPCAAVLGHQPSEGTQNPRISLPFPSALPPPSTPCAAVLGRQPAPTTGVLLYVRLRTADVPQRSLSAGCDGPLMRHGHRVHVRSVHAHHHAPIQVRTRVNV